MNVSDDSKRALVFTFTNLIWGLQLLVLHLPQHVVGGAQGSHLGVASADKARQADKPQAVAVTQQAFGPHLWHRRVGFGHPLRRLNLLRRERSNTDFD